MAKNSILLIDDNVEVLDGLEGQLSQLLSPDDVEIRRWLPTYDEGQPEEIFRSKVDDNTVLVATDYDLTSKGLKGLFGLTIVGWCQGMSIPVGDFSRGHTKDLPDEPNLFELRVPPDDEKGAQFIAAAFGGFHWLREALAGDDDLFSNNRSLAAVLAGLLGRPHLDSQFALYMTRLGSANSALMQRLRTYADPTKIPDDDGKSQVVAYVLGHVLLNAILKFPGPILSDEALCAYIATANSEADALHTLFEPALYNGPFATSARYYWREEVDTILDAFGEPIATQSFDGFGDFNRAAVEAKRGGPLADHDCDRCDGKKGGFLCPFTHRPVCERNDCSVPTSSWIPQGAQLSRVERDYYEEWAPLLGL